MKDDPHRSPGESRDVEERALALTGKLSERSPYAEAETQPAVELILNRNGKQ